MIAEVPRSPFLARFRVANHSGVDAIIVNRRGDRAPPLLILWGSPDRRRSALRCVTGEDVARSFAGKWQGKQASCSALSPGFLSVKSANPQPPVAAYFFESLTMNCTFTRDPITND